MSTKSAVDLAVGDVVENEEHGPCTVSRVTPTSKTSVEVILSINANGDTWGDEFANDHAFALIEGEAE